MRTAWFALLLIVCLLVGKVWAASVTTVTITESTSGTQIVASIGGGVTVTNPAGGGVIYVARIEGDCATVLTAPRGVAISAGNGYDFIPKTDGWSGQLCSCLASGSTDITASVNSW